ncbi:Phosphoribosylformylglycinamidine cyclo-ligase, partial [hydrothermal vent metagenome]
FCVGAVERNNMLPRRTEPGDIMIGLASSGAHSNGYSLIRKVAADSGAAFDDPAPFNSAVTLGEALLAPTRIYVKSVLPVLTDIRVKAFAHITGGGLSDNVPRVLSDNLLPRFDDNTLGLPPLFEWLRDAGNLSGDEMRRTFNCGIGGVLIAGAEAVDDVITTLKNHGEDARVIGDIIET